MMDDYTRKRLNEADRLDGLGFPENAAAVRVSAVELLSQKAERASARVLELEGGEGDTFALRVELGSDAMRTPEAVAAMLRQTAERVELGYTSAAVLDVNGNTRGRWSVSYPADLEATAELERMAAQLEPHERDALENDRPPRRLAEVHAVQRETGDGDGLYLFENSEQAEAYAALFGGEVVSVPVNDPGSALELIEGEEKALEDEAADEGRR